MGKVRVWLHRHRYARLLNCSSNNMNRFGTAYVETWGPFFVGKWLALHIVRHDPLTRPDWATIQVARTERIGRYRYRWVFRYERTSR